MPYLQWFNVRNLSLVALQVGTLLNLSRYAVPIWPFLSELFVVYTFIFHCLVRSPIDAINCYRVWDCYGRAIEVCAQWTRRRWSICLCMCAAAGRAICVCVRVSLYVCCHPGLVCWVVYMCVCLCWRVYCLGPDNHRCVFLPEFCCCHYVGISF